MKNIFMWSVLSWTLWLSSTAVQAGWIKEGPVTLTKLGDVEVLVSQLDAVNVKVLLLNDENETIAEGKAEERRIKFDLISPGSYALYVYTDGFAPIKIYWNTQYFKFINE